MALPLRIMRSVLAIPKWFGRLITPQKRSKDYISLTVEEVIEFNVSKPTRQNLSSVATRPARQGVSPQVLEMLERTMEEYKEDLDYLKDR